jgi:hypothetical protein
VVQSQLQQALNRRIQTALLGIQIPLVFKMMSLASRLGATTLPTLRRMASSSRRSSSGGVERKIALVLGSSGALGSTVAKYLSRELGMSVLGADIMELPKEFNQTDWDLDGFITLPSQDQGPCGAADVTAELALGVYESLGVTDTIDIIVVASVRYIHYPKKVPVFWLSHEKHPFLTRLDLT